MESNHLTERLPAGAYLQAAHFGLQDTAPRDALIGMHARVENCEPSAWEHPDLTQTYGPRGAVYVLPKRDLGIFTVGRLPLDEEQRRPIEQAADEICRLLGGEERRGGHPDLRTACASGRLILRWTTSALYAREVPRPTVDFAEAHRELCRRHVQAFGPTTPQAFAWWSSLSPRDAREVWQWIAPELLPVDLAGRDAWILATEEDAIRSTRPAPVARLLVASDLRVLGQDRYGLFVGPGMRRRSRLHDSFHPHGVVLDGEIAGAWGRRGGRFDVLVEERLSGEQREAIAAEALSTPVPGATPTIELTEV
ncbi:winged helix DNA-binding protein [Kribbella voronezhensis]|uniref:Winged helix DNA-binding protein n=2 Tax=Kribbella voronezhensis TaxID=2512212 RepID=A0A4V3FJK3_9ACTN|nr:winged helix DNA-binding protein [Kribbella voronezhensis]